MSRETGGGEIHRADPAYRRQMLAWLAVTVLAGAIGLFALYGWLAELHAHAIGDDPFRVERWLRRLIAGFSLLLAAASGGFGVWLWRVAQQARQQKRWPPLGLRTTRDVPVRYLTAAEAHARSIELAVWMLAMFGVAMVFWGLWILYG